MQMRALAGLAMAAAVAWSGSARAAERPTAEAIRAAAKAVAPAVVDVEAAVRQWGGVVPDIRVWPPGQEIPQPRGRQWQWQWQRPVFWLRILIVEACLRRSSAVTTL